MSASGTTFCEREAPAEEVVYNQRAQGRALAELVAIEVQRAARHARVSNRRPRLKAPEIKALLPKAWPNTFTQPRMLGFLIMVVLPTLLATLYFGFIASSFYQTEARFAVRAGAISGVDEFTSGAGLSLLNTVQDSLIVADFVVGRAAVEALDEEIGLRERFASKSIDPFTRMAVDAPMETLVAKWRRNVSANIESPSGIITVRVTAYSPEDAKLIADALISESEALVNRLGARAREDLVRNSEAELMRAEERLRDARERLMRLRREEGVIDPKLTAEGINMLLTELRTEAARIDREIIFTERMIAGNAPQLAPIQARREALREQIIALQDEMTARRPDDRESISEVMTRFDQLALERQILERQYASAAGALEQARASAARQQMYLATFVRPVMPQEPAGPARFLMVVGVFFGTLILWALTLSLTRFAMQRIDNGGNWNQ